MSDSEDSSLGSKPEDNSNALVESSAKEVNSDNESLSPRQENDNAEDIDHNNYERDGFVVSDDEASDASDSDTDVKKPKRKRKRLKRRAPVLDEDDIQLIKDNLNEETGEQFSSESKRFKGDNDDLSVDSDGMDEFIVDNSMDYSNRKRRDNFPKTLTAEMEFAEEQNKEFLELFGYNKEDYETYEQSAPEKSQTSTMQEKLKSTFNYSELAKNYLLESDITISQLDVPERIQLKEKALGLNRNKHNRGEFFLRFKLSAIKSKEDLLKSIEQQRERQAKWVYNNLINRQYSKITKDLSYDVLSKPLLFILKCFQLYCYEPAYLFVYFSFQIKPFSFDDLFDIQDLSYDYCNFIYKTDRLLKLAEKVYPATHHDESEVLILKELKLDQEEIEPYLDDLQYKDKLIASSLKAENAVLLERFFPKNLVQETEDLTLPNETGLDSFKRVLANNSTTMTIQDIDNIQKSLIYEFGSTYNSSTEQQVENTTVQNTGDEDENSLFGDDSDDETPQSPSKVSSMPKVKEFFAKRRGFTHSKIKSPEFDAFLKLIVHIPFVERQLRCLTNTDDLPTMSANISKDFITNPYRLGACILLKDNRNHFKKNLHGLYEACFSVLSRHLMHSAEFLNHLKRAYRKYGNVSTKPGANFSLLLPDFGHKYLPIACIDRKPFQEFLNDSDDFEFLWILKAQKDQMVEISFNVEANLLPHLSEALERIIYSEGGYDFIVKRDGENLDYSPDILEKEGYTWDSIRCRFLSHLLLKVVKPWILKQMKRELMEKSRLLLAREIERIAIQQYFKSSLRLPYKDLLQYAPDYIPKSLKVDAGSAALRVLSLHLSNTRYDFEALKVKNFERFDIGAAVVVSGEGLLLSNYDLPSLLEMDKLKARLKAIISKEGPHFVLFNSDHGVVSKHIFSTLEGWSMDANEEAKNNQLADKNCKHNPYKFFVPLIPDTTVSSIWAQTEYLKQKSGSSNATMLSISELKALSTALFMLHPVGEVSKLYVDLSREDIKQDKSISSGLKGLKLHPLQSELPTKQLLKTFERVFIKFISLNPIDVLSLLRPGSSNRFLLQFVPGMGARKAARFISDLQRMDTPLISRLQLKTIFGTSSKDPSYEDEETLNLDKFPLGVANLQGALAKVEIDNLYDAQDIPGCVYENSIGFFYFTKDLSTQSDIDTTYIFNPFDKTRIHPKHYKLASLLCWMVTHKEKPMPKFVEAKLSLALQVEESVQFEEDHDPTGNEKSSNVKTDRDDFLIPNEILDVVTDSMDKSEVEVSSITEVQNPCFLEEMSHNCLECALNDNQMFTNLEDIINSITSGEDSLRFAIDKKLEELSNDSFIEKDIIEIVKLSSTATNDFSTVQYIMMALQEIRFPMLPIKSRFPVDKRIVLFRKLMGQDMKSIQLGSLVSANITEFTFKGVQLRFANGFRSLVPISSIPSKGRPILESSSRLSKEEQLEEYCNRELGIFLNDVVNAWIIKIDPEAFSLDCTLVEKDAFDKINFTGEFKEFRMLEDLYFESKEKLEEGLSGENTGRRVTHTDFFNLTPNKCAAKLEGLAPGEYFFKPSSKGFLFLSLYWKVVGNRLNNQVIEELDKDESDPELGKRLRIGKREFEDLDDIVANYISPVNSFLTEVSNYSKHFREISLPEAERLCETEKRKKRDLIPYYIIPDSKIATYFHFVFQPSRSVHKVSFAVKPEGFCLDRNAIFKSLQALLKHLKGIISKTLKANQRRGEAHKHGDSRRYDNYGSHGTNRHYSNQRYGRDRMPYTSSSYRR